MSEKFYYQKMTAISTFENNPENNDIARNFGEKMFNGNTVSVAYLINQLQNLDPYAQLECFIVVEQKNDQQPS